MNHQELRRIVFSVSRKTRTSGINLTRRARVAQANFWCGKYMDWQNLWN